MLQIRIADIPDEGLEIDAAAELAEALAGEGWSLHRAVLRVERQGAEVAVVGEVEATIRLSCSRCLEPVVAQVEPRVDLRIRPTVNAGRAEVELGADDLEVDFYQGDTLDLTGLLRGEVDLALPMKPLCRAECRGLCPSCGGNLNVTSCACARPTVDPRLAPLEALRRRIEGR